MQKQNAFCINVNKEPKGKKKKQWMVYTYDQKRDKCNVNILLSCLGSRAVTVW